MLFGVYLYEKNVTKYNSIQFIRIKKLKISNFHENQWALIKGLFSLNAGWFFVNWVLC